MNTRELTSDEANAINVLTGGEGPKVFIHTGFELRQIKQNPPLRLLSSSETIVIPACNGTQTLAQAKQAFPSGIDADFKNWGLDTRGSATEETAVSVYELCEGATSTRIFGTLGTDLNDVCLTQHQIIKFCEENRKWLRLAHTIFLFRAEGNFFVAHAGDNGLRIHVRRLGHIDVWNIARAHRVVVPLL
ncbi:hypothetical protein AUJ77_01250 [Candidatus Nomurabacteria bacterium CG1_02_43_90]|uniref:Uncharacterized protein n=1 Tax=Candidatus Nomurabacteria bacterium CG1_02_43_90 TaxID=1805281 RepID=A0A1J4V838_9BACT|nr:MAG: hypothetical protein AUJ77_01250 [Candidatus Nomurabacteria bacterium CG1_02_43_90]